MPGQATLREVVEALAPLERRAGSDAERRAAVWIVERLRLAGARDARVEEATFLDGYAPLIGGLCALAAAAGVTALATRRGRVPALVAGLGAAAAIADDVSNGPRFARRAVQRPRPTQNVVAEAGDPAAERTLVVMEDYRDPSFRDPVARVAESAGVPLRRGMRWRNSTDSVIPQRAGYAIATLASMNRFKAMSNYHLMTDTPENVDYGTVAQAVDVVDGVARALGGAALP